MNVLAFVANAAQAEIVTRAAPDAMIATGDFDLLAERADSANVVDLWRWVDETTQDRNRDRAWEFGRRVSATLAGRYVFRGCDLVDACKFDLFWAAQAALNCTAAARGAMRELIPQCVIHFSEMALAGMEISPRGAPDIFNACAAAAADEAKVSLKALSCPVQVSATAFKPTAAVDAKSAMPVALPGRVDAVAISEQLGVDEQALLFEEAVRLRQPWVSVSGEAPQSMMPYLPLKQLRWLPFALGELPERIGRFRDDAVLALREALAESYQEIFANRRLDFIWEHFAQHVRAALDSFAMGEFLGGALAPRVALIGYDVPGPGRALVAGFAAKGVPVVSVDHAGMANDCSNRMNEDCKTHLAVWGEADKKNREFVKPSGCRVASVGSVRRDLASGRCADAARKKRIVFFTCAENDGCHFIGWAAPSDVRAVWREIAEIVRGLGVGEIAVKPHPRYDHVSFYERQLSREIPGLKVLRCNAQMALEGASAAVLVCSASTVLAQIIRAGVPALYMRKGVQSWAHSPMEDGGVVVCDDESALRDALANALYDDAWREATVARQREFLGTILVATGSEAASRLTRFMGEVASNEDSSPDPANRWLLDLLDLVGRRLRGGVVDASFREMMRQLSSSFDSAWACGTSLRWGTIGRWLLDVVTWSGPGGDSRFETAQAVAQLLPPAIQPERAVVREYLAELADQEREVSQGVQRVRQTVRLLTLAPGRVLRPATATRP